MLILSSPLLLLLLPLLLLASLWHLLFLPWLLLLPLCLILFLLYCLLSPLLRYLCSPILFLPLPPVPSLSSLPVLFPSSPPVLRPHRLLGSANCCHLYFPFCRILSCSHSLSGSPYCLSWFSGFFSCSSCLLFVICGLCFWLFSCSF